MLRKIYRWTFCCLIGLTFDVYADTALDDDFYAARPRVQLYMAYAEFKMGHHQTAIAMWQKIGGAGRAEARFNLANLYLQGIGVDADRTRAEQLYLEAAQAGSRAAVYQLGLFYLEADQQEARRWLRIAALDGDRDAGELLAQLDSGEVATDSLVQVDRLLVQGQVEQALDLLVGLARGEAGKKPDFNAVTRLAWLYESGLGVERDLARAAELFQLAANAGIAEAQYALSVMYYTGQGRPLDQVLALQWLKRAAASGYGPARQQLARPKGESE